jgi:hypothetical protein
VLPNQHHEVRVALRFRIRISVPEQGALFQNWVPHIVMVPIWGLECPSPGTRPVPKWGPTYTSAHEQELKCNTLSYPFNSETRVDQEDQGESKSSKQIQIALIVQEVFTTQSCQND